MAQGNPISRRNLFRRSFGIRTQKDEGGPKEPHPSPETEAVLPDPVAAENAAPEKILKRIDAEPAYRLVLQRLLAFCSEPRSSREIYDELLYYPGMRTAAHTPKMLFAWMVEVGAIAGYTEEGSETALWLTTEAGMEAVAGRDPAERLRRLLEEEPAYVDIYRMILEFCTVERSISEIEYLLRANPALANPKVYPSYLVDRLEFAGALEWTGKWRATETGKEILR
ncbi:MAG: hypothetical protein FWF13_03680 [Acidobacteria bacterium]|nr:hypothetical protein [Acidobacteriota bacterium]